MRDFFLCLWGGPWSEKRGLMILETSHWDACASIRFLLDLEILKTSLWLLPFFRKLDIHQTSPLITGGFFERLVGRVLLCGEVTGSSSKCCCGAVVSTWWTRHQNHRLLLGWRECGWLPQNEIRGSKGCGWWWWPGWVGGNYPHEMFFFCLGWRFGRFYCKTLTFW